MTDIKTHRLKLGLIDRWIDRKTDLQTEILTERNYIDRQIERQYSQRDCYKNLILKRHINGIDRQIDRYTYIYSAKIHR